MFISYFEKKCHIKMMIGQIRILRTLNPIIFTILSNARLGIKDKVWTRGMLVYCK